MLSNHENQEFLKALDNIYIASSLTEFSMKYGQKSLFLAFENTEFFKPITIITSMLIYVMVLPKSHYRCFWGF